MPFTRRNFTKNILLSSITFYFLAYLSSNVFGSTYIVKKGDSLSKIAKRYGTSVYKIKRVNRLKSDKILIGQKLKIPEPKYYSDKDPLKHIKYHNSKIKVSRNKWSHIIAHHSATERGNASIFDDMHHKRGMKNGLAYHFVIGNGTDSKDGQIEMGSRWIKQIDGGHVKNQYINKVGIGICLVGNFEKRKPTQSQIKSLIALTNWLSREILRRKIRFLGHKQIKNERTLCPGKYFPLNSLNRKYS